jgi:hypothetical protein
VAQPSVIRVPRDLPSTTHTPTFTIFLISLTRSAAAKAHQYASTGLASTNVSRVAILSLLSGGQALCNNHLELSGTGSCTSAGRAVVAYLGRHPLPKRVPELLVPAPGKEGVSTLIRRHLPFVTPLRGTGLSCQRARVVLVYSHHIQTLPHCLRTLFCLVSSIGAGHHTFSFTSMSLPDLHNLTEEVSSSNMSCRCVEYVGHWQKNTPIGSVIGPSSSPASVAFTFNGEPYLLIYNVPQETSHVQSGPLQALRWGSTVPSTAVPRKFH